jgi:GntR family transcriptional regulator of abcA and norABC
MAHIPIDSLTWRPSRTAPVPLHEQIVNYVKSQVSSGAWPLGARLPTQRALALAFGVNRSTIVAALAQLQDFGIIQARGAAGTFVASNSWSLLMANRATQLPHARVGSIKQNQHIAELIAQSETNNATIAIGSSQLDPALLPQPTGHTSRTYSVDPYGHVEPAGLLSLRQALAQHLQEQGINVTPQQLLITSGNLQAMRLMCLGLIEPGACIITGKPTYARSLRTLEDASLTRLEVPMDERGIIPAALETATRETIDAGIPCVWYSMPTNHNPCGTTLAPSRRQAVLHMATQLHLPIIEDGSYGELSFSEAPAPLAALDTHQVVIYVGSANKCFAPGLRVGWIAASEQVIAHLTQVKRLSDYGAATPSQMVLARALNDGTYAAHAQHLRQELAARCTQALAALKRHFTGLATWHAPTGGYYIWVEFNAPIAKDQLFSEALEHHILLGVYDVFDHQDANGIRLSFAAVPPLAFEAAVCRLAQIVSHCLRA